MPPRARRPGTFHTGSAPMPGDATVQGRGSELERRRDILMRRKENEARLKKAGNDAMLERRDRLMREIEARKRAAARMLDRRDALMKKHTPR